MNRGVAVGVYVLGGMITAVSQLLLKVATRRTDNLRGIQKYVNARVIVAYVLLFATVFLSMFAMRYLPYKYGSVLASLSFVFVLILGRIVLHERIGMIKLIGIILIILGTIVFYI